MQNSNENLHRSSGTSRCFALTYSRNCGVKAADGRQRGRSSPYLKNSRSIGPAHLHAASSIYLLLGMVWEALYWAKDILYPGSIQPGTHPADRQRELLDFRVITLSTIGYGDVAV